MKLSLVVTVLNEEKSIGVLLSSIVVQTKLPQEIIFVDGGSNDKTVQIIFQKSKEYPKLKIKLFKKKGNISVGRNEGIRKASGKIILSTDAGCILEKYWILNLVKNFENGADIVAGFYKPISNSTFQKCLATYTSTMEDKIDKRNFLASSRSFAFKKSAWKSVGGYPEWLDYSEDLYFSNLLMKSDLKFKFAKNAIVYWPQRKNLLQAARQFYNYALGDGIARYIRSSTPILFARYIFGIILVILYLITNSLFLLILTGVLLINYVLWSIFKNYRYINERKALVYLPFLQFTADFSVLLGMTIGFTKSFSSKKEKIPLFSL